jgi:hypothetical protein
MLLASMSPSCLSVGNKRVTLLRTASNPATGPSVCAKIDNELNTLINDNCLNNADGSTFSK